MKRLLFPIIAVALLAAVGCDRAKLTPQQTYGMSTLEISDELTKAGEQLGTTMEPWFSGGTFEPEKAETALLGLKDTVDSVQERINKLSIPPDAVSQEYAKAMDDYLNFEKTDAIAMISKALETAKAANPASPEIRQGVIDEMVALNDSEIVWKEKLHSLVRKLGVTIKDQP